MATVQSIQSGSKTIVAADGTSVTETITSVTTAQSVVMISVRNAQSSQNRVRRELWTAQLTNSTTITFTRDQSSFAVDSIIEWYVIEWDSSVTVHRGSATPTASSSSHSIGATINTGSSFPVVYAKTNQNSILADVICRATMSTTNITFTFGSTPSSGDCVIEWQIVEFDSADADVQTGTISLGSGVGSNTAAITSVTTADTFVAHGGIETTNSGAGDHRNSATVELTNATTVTAEQTLIGSGRTQDVQFYAVEMLDGSSVEKGTETITDTNATPTTQPSFTAMSNPSPISTHFTQNDRNTDTSTDQYHGDGLVSLAINGTDDGMVLERHSSATDSDVKVVWHAVDWNAGGGPTTHNKTLTMTAVGSSSLSNALEFYPTYSITATGTSSVARMLDMLISSSATGEGTSTVTKEAKKTLSITSNQAATVVKEAQKTIPATATGTATQDEGLVTDHSASSSATGGASLSTSILYSLGGTIKRMRKWLARNIVRPIARRLGL